MNKVTYEIVEHDGGWAYKVGGTYSETFASRSDAVAAARTAAAEQQVAGDAAGQAVVAVGAVAMQQHDEMAGLAAAMRAVARAVELGHVFFSPFFSRALQSGMLRR